MNEKSQLTVPNNLKREPASSQGREMSESDLEQVCMGPTAVKWNVSLPSTSRNYSVNMEEPAQINKGQSPECTLTLTYHRCFGNQDHVIETQTRISPMLHHNVKPGLSVDQDTGSHLIRVQILSSPWPEVNHENNHPDIVITEALEQLGIPLQPNQINNLDSSVRADTCVSPEANSQSALDDVHVDLFTPNIPIENISSEPALPVLSKPHSPLQTQTEPVLQFRQTRSQELSHLSHAALSADWFLRSRQSAPVGQQMSSETGENFQSLGYTESAESLATSPSNCTQFLNIPKTASPVPCLKNALISCKAGSSNSQLTDARSMNCRPSVSRSLGSSFSELNETDAQPNSRTTGEVFLPVINNVAACGNYSSPKRSLQELNRFPSPPPAGSTPPTERDTESARQARRLEKERLLKELEEAKEDRKNAEKEREELVKKAKQLQSKTQNRRNHARDVWKKRYFEEKKKTPPLEEQCSRLRADLDSLHRKLMASLEGPKQQKGLNVSTGRPSQRNNYVILCTKLQHEIEDLHRRVENAKMKLTAEMKLRMQAEVEARTLRTKLTQKKVSLHGHAFTQIY